MLTQKIVFSVFATFAITLVGASLAPAQTREEKVRADKEKVIADGFWMYNDIPGAMAEGKKSGKPVLVVLRCIPCEECVKLDDDLVDKDPVIRPLLNQFVCVRQVSTNGLDLSLFQFDTDQSFAVFMLNAEGTVYGRFGTRSHRTEWYGDVSLEGLAKALRGALDLHADYPRIKASLAGKHGAALEVASPEQYPALKEKYTDSLNYEGNVVQSCIHCHQIGEAQRTYYWAANKTIPESILFPYPHPKSLGLTMDPTEMATVKSVSEDSVAARSGIRDGDVIESFNGQPMLSIADLQWVLHRIDPAGESVPLRVKRDGKSVDLAFSVDEGWRRSGDISWRASTWSLRRMVTGGMVLSEMSDERGDDLPKDSMALLVKHIGQYGPHAAAKKAGFLKDDVLISYDGRTDLNSESALLRHALTNHKPGDRVEVTVLRNGQRKQMKLPIQQ